MNPKMVSNDLLSTPLLSAKANSQAADEGPETTSNPFKFQILTTPGSYKSLATLTGHTGPVSCLALCGEFVLSASHGKDIIVWQNPDLKQFTRFGQGGGSVKALVSVGDKVFTAHQDSRVRVWKVSRSSENVFKLVDTLPTTKDYLGNFMKQSSYVQTRRNHKRLWIEHADSISCLAVYNGLVYSGSWDKTLKVWRISDLKCLESIKAHDDAINALAVSKEGILYSASADGKIKAWGKDGNDKGGSHSHSHSLKGILDGYKEGISVNSVVVSEDGKRVYGGGSDGSITSWLGSKDWKMTCRVNKAHKMAVLCMCLKGEILCSGSSDASIGIWNCSREGGMGGVLYRVGVIKGHIGPVKCLQASPMSIGGGFMLYSGSLDKSIRVWWVPKYMQIGLSSSSATRTTSSTVTSK